MSVFTPEEQQEIHELVRLGDPYNQATTECEARQLILMRHVAESDYCLVPVEVRLPQVWIGHDQVSWPWDNS